MGGLVSVEMHDVAPATWPRCKRLLDALERVGARRITLLVVPWYHRGVTIDRAPEFVDAISRRLVRGDEAVLHGYVHLDEAAPPRSVRGFVERRLLTRREGEFAAIEADEARERIARAIAIWRRTGWRLAGFVPPAWLLCDAAREAIARGRRFEYVALRGALYRLPGWERIPTDTMWYSATSGPRRWMSRAGLAIVGARSSSRLLRIALHPQDADFPGVVNHWQQIVRHALASRTPITTRGALASLAPCAPVTRALREPPRPIR